MLRRFLPVVVSSLLLGAATAGAAFELRSTDVSDGATLTKAQVYSGFGCTGENLSPALMWTGAPAGTQSFALTLYDPDAPTGSGWGALIRDDLSPRPLPPVGGVPPPAPPPPRQVQRGRPPPRGPAVRGALAPPPATSRTATS